MPRVCGTPGAPAEPGAHRGRASEGPSADADPAVPAQQRHQRDADREPQWAEDTMKAMIVTLAGRPRMRSSDGGRAPEKLFAALTRSQFKSLLCPSSVVPCVLEHVVLASLGSAPRSRWVAPPCRRRPVSVAVLAVPPPVRRACPSGRSCG